MIEPKSDIDRLEELLKVITQLPWKYDSYNTLFAGSAQQDNIVEICAIPDHPSDSHYTPEQQAEKGKWYAESQANIQLIEALSNAAPAMIEELRRLREVETKARDLMKQVESDDYVNETPQYEVLRAALEKGKEPRS